MRVRPDPARALPSTEPGRPAIDLAATRALVPHVLDWLRQRDRARLLRTVDGWPPRTRTALRHLLTTQGLAPLVADVASADTAGADIASAETAAADIAAADIAAADIASADIASADIAAADIAGAGADAASAPTGAHDTAAWLAGQLRQNRVRAGRFADYLAAILAGASASGLPVMPLKGGLVAFTRHREPGLRPMADLDLLVRPADEPGLHAVLARLGYGLVGSPDGRHREFERPGERVVALDGTHPDNPRSVEVHTRLQRSVWFDHGGVDVAPLLWASGREQALLGQPAFLPSDAALLVDVAAHATAHLMRGSGMLLHWFDIAALATDVEGLDDAVAAWTYPALALAARAFGGERLSAQVAGLAPAAGASLVRLAARVPLDDRAGLNLRGLEAARLGWLESRWRRWWPNPWLVHFAHPRLPSPLAYAGYLGGVGAHAARRLRAAHAARRLRGG